ncbi:low temperature-induced protein [Phormidium sp. CCY1219]|uniref:low temperature-induced protein n=1 Tax=Phormidium sp. CCY1219 TaxID=2886104 RepID=UPI002D1EA3EA|nr:low temperature-induced protein [Phormidium sp. CCY1219]MEB3829330.1 low temperature-induced protein [Phormidium sp. CCY1219]
MRSMSLKLRKFRPFRLLVAACVCALLFFSSVLPAYAAVKSPMEGEDKLLKVEKESQEVVGKDPASMNEQIEKTNPGLNVVQGDADKEKMVSPEETDESSFSEQVKKTFDNLTGRE